MIENVELSGSWEIVRYSLYAVSVVVCAILLKRSCNDAILDFLRRGDSATYGPSLASHGARNGISVHVDTPASFSKRPLLFAAVLPALTIGLAYGSFVGGLLAFHYHDFGHGILAGVITVALVALLILGANWIRVSASAVWLSSGFFGGAIGALLFNLIWLAIFAVVPELSSGDLPWLLRIPIVAVGITFVLFVGMILLWITWFVGLGYLWFHRTVLRALPVSPGFITISFLLATPISAISAGNNVVALIFIFPALVVIMFVPLLITRLLSLLVPRSDPIQLLYLRCFDLGRKSGRMFSRVAAEWAPIGPVFALSGPDVSARTLDSDALWHFLRDSIEDQFIQGEGDVRLQVSRARRNRGWDLLFRRTEFKCVGPIWQRTFKELLAQADLVFLDLRGFNKAQSGASYELEQVAAAGALSRALVIIDNTTDVEDVARIVSHVNLGSTESVPLVDVGRSGLHASRDAIRLLKILGQEIRKSKRGRA
jgi:hypothetical protein